MRIIDDANSVQNNTGPLGGPVIIYINPLEKKQDQGDVANQQETS